MTPSVCAASGAGSSRSFEERDGAVTAENPVAGPSESRRPLMLELLDTGLDRVDGRACVARALGGGGGGGGGAAAPVAGIWIARCGEGGICNGSRCVTMRCDPSIQRALLITKDGHVSPRAHSLSGIEIYESAHPVPTAFARCGRTFVQMGRRAARRRGSPCF